MQPRGIIKLKLLYPLYCTVTINTFSSLFTIIGLITFFKYLGLPSLDNTHCVVNMCSITCTVSFHKKCLCNVCGNSTVGLTSAVQ